MLEQRPASTWCDFQAELDSTLLVGSAGIHAVQPLHRASAGTEHDGWRKWHAKAVLQMRPPRHWGVVSSIFAAAEAAGWHLGRRWRQRRQSRMRARDGQSASALTSATRIHAKEPLGWPRSELSDSRHAEDGQRCRSHLPQPAWWKAAQVSVGDELSEAGRNLRVQRALAPPNEVEPLRMRVSQSFR